MNTSAAQLQQELIDWSVEHSGYEERRPYIGLSGLFDCEREIYRKYHQKTASSVPSQLRTRISYELESVLKARLIQALFGKRKFDSESREISLYDGLVQGHTDGEIEGILLEIKTVPMAEHIPLDRIPARVLWQVQAYMHYGEYPAAYVIYLDRGTGQIRVFHIEYDAAFGRKIEAKVLRVVQAIRAGRMPRCGCGKCR